MMIGSVEFTVLSCFIKVNTEIFGDPITVIMPLAWVDSTIIISVISSLFSLVFISSADILQIVFKQTQLYLRDKALRRRGNDAIEDLFDKFIL